MSYPVVEGLALTFFAIAIFWAIINIAFQIVRAGQIIDWVSPLLGADTFFIIGGLIWRGRRTLGGW